MSCFCLASPPLAKLQNKRLEDDLKCMFFCILALYPRDLQNYMLLQLAAHFVFCISVLRLHDLQKKMLLQFIVHFVFCIPALCPHDLQKACHSTAKEPPGRPRGPNTIYLQYCVDSNVRATHVYLIP